MEKHNILEDFPEFKDKIHALKTSQSHFKKVYEDYENVTHLVYRAESGAEVMGEDELEKLLKKRVHLKDEIYSLLRK
jgi:uncharacterized protein